MIGLDTNVLVRYLTQDDPAQARKANALISELIAAGDRAYVSTVVLCELVWVLRDAYDCTKPDLLRTLDLLVSTRQFEIGDKDLVREAIEAYRPGPGDFADYVIGAVHRSSSCTETVTFDRRLRREPGFRVL